MHKKNYLNHDLGIVVFDLKIWRDYLYGIHVDVLIDYKSLSYVFTQKKLNLCQRRWLELLKNYDMNVLNHPSKSNVVTDALSRLSMGSFTHVIEERGTSKRCSPACFPRSSSYKHIRWWYNISEWVTIFVVAEVEETKDSDHILLQLKGAVH